ncbi:hypothetical protein SO802_002363 [Lithocarpus litseifolius]|uniref:SWIM-type domain-containing protein n=1 Tax=Lithocarpus litseifolius TaxID=425828 RepID=A0AAW2E0T5_9ROSI
MISRSTTKKLCAKCVDESCKWYVCAVMRPNLHGLWMITVYVSPHTCIPTGVRNDGRMMTCNFIVSDILKKLCEDHTTPIKHLRSMIESKYKGHKPSYYKVFYSTKPTSEDDTLILHYMFWSFGPSINGFKYCKSVISIDGTHLYGKYQGKLLVAMATDANNKVFRLAFAVVDCESGSSWSWFLKCLRDTIGHVIPDEGICIISDRHLGIKNAIANWPRGDDGQPRVFHRYCLRNVASNFNTHYQNSTLKSAALKAGYATQAVKFDTIMDSIKQVEIEAIRKKKKSHDGGRCFGAMTTNISECFNGVLKGAWGLPIAAMVEFTWSKLVEYFHDRDKEITNELMEGKKWSTYAFSTWEGNRHKSEKHYVKAFSAQEMRYQVVTSHNTCSAGGGNHSYEVRLLERTCSCGKWQNIGIPCSHIIRVCDATQIDSTIYIHPSYSLNYARSTYSHAFVVPKSQSLWREPMGPKWLPNPALTCE